MDNTSPHAYDAKRITATTPEVLDQVRAAGRWRFLAPHTQELWRRYAA